MKIINLERDIFQFVFGPRKNTLFGYNIYVITNNDTALMIDTGFREHSQAVKTYLGEKGITVTDVIISHFHLDHINGLKALDQVNVIGSNEYQRALDVYIEKNQQEQYKPTDLVKDQKIFSFGDHLIKVKKHPGHAKCSVLVEIDDKYLHVGDELMFSNDGEPILPLVDLKRIDEQIHAYVKLAKHVDRVLWTSHGKIGNESGFINRAIDSYKQYLIAIKDSKKTLSYNEATEKCPMEFLHKEWHGNIYK